MKGDGKLELETLAVKENEKYTLQLEDTNDKGLENIDEIEDEVEYQLTVRSVVIGTFLGCVMSASNLYLGYKTGIAFYACFFGSILGFGMGKLMEPLPTFLGGGKLGIRENCSIQTAATATGLLSSAFVGPIPVLFRSKVIETLDEAWGPMFCWMIGASFFGMFFAVPMRSYFVIQQDLAFPGPSAAAHMINKLHSGKGSIPRKQTMALVYALFGAIFYKVLTYFVPVLNSIHIIYWVGHAASYVPFKLIDATFGWYIVPSPAYLGIGMTAGLNTGLSLMLGTIISWGVLAPSLFYYVDDVNKTRVTGSIPNSTTAQNWLLWVGIVIMLTASLAEILVNYKSVFSALRDPMVHVYNNYLLKVFTSLSPIEAIVYENKDPVHMDQQIPAWQWASGLAVSVVFTILTYHFYFEIHVGLTLLACVLSFLLSYVTCQIYGETFINISNTMAKGTQIVFSGIPASTPKLLFSSNLLSGALTSIAATQATEMVGDLKTGHILKASPKSQFYAQILATVPGILASVALFYVFAKAYPCIIDKTITAPSDACPFTLISVLNWEFITNALVKDGIDIIPYTCRLAMLICFLLTLVITLLRVTVFKKYSKYIPNMAVVGMAFAFPGSSVSFGVLVGGIIAFLWEKFFVNSYKLYFVSVASGLVAGEGIGGLIVAIFTIAGMNQVKYATDWGCITSAVAC